ncbi:hydrogenase maturation nickel metallochaperone HypA [Oricola sp.]|uniref:hydrogenase maturation nickel metallochaperone HypA n=1 Tax=Oricola sp. TaxID=1979950 RepID=UPI003BAA2CE4
MHEMAMCRNILEIIEEQAAAQGFAKVKRISLEIGPLAGVEVEALKFGFDVVTRGSLADGATIDIIRPEARARCLDCGADMVIQQRYDPCPRCGSHRLQIASGDELRVKELEVA